MRFLIVNTDYPEFLAWLYCEHPRLKDQVYDEQVRIRSDTLHGASSFYASNLRQLGHEAWDVRANNEFMQRAWAHEHGLRIEEPKRLHQGAYEILQRGRRVVPKTVRRNLKPLFRPLLHSPGDRQAWLYGVLSAQIKRYRPDVLLNQNIGLSSNFFREAKPYTRLLVGQHASPLPHRQDLSVYDLIISSLPNLVDHFTREGIRSELHRFGFEPRVLTMLGEVKTSVKVSFVGSVFPVHASRRRWLEYVCQRTSVEIWGQDVSSLSNGSPIVGCHRGTAWGLDMYRILQSSHITLNHHIDVAECYANNMRLFEATGAGTLLITDWKENLHELFEPDREVVAYRTPQECVELIHYYLNHDDERTAIAQAGRERTLREHTYYDRMKRLVEIVSKFL